MSDPAILSIVIPCKNEGKHLHKTLGALVREQEYGFIKEIIFVDNESSDNSIEIASEYPVTVISTSGTIAKVRNTGVESTTGEFLCFLDADIEVVDGWTKAVVDFINNNPDICNKAIIGDAYGLPHDAGWIEKVWFKSLQKVTSHVNSGNMVMSKPLFNELKGFDENLATAEDFDICQRAEALGGEIVITPELETIHYGYPGKLGDFYRRERWHGLGMSKHLFSPYKSKPLCLAYFVLFSPLLLIAGLNIFGVGGVIVTVSMLFLISLYYCMYRLNKYFTIESLQLLLLIIVYALARTHSLLNILSRNLNKESWKQKKRSK